MYSCPVCKKDLKLIEKTYSCENNHSFDIAKQGYVNLLLANKKNSKEPGDSKEMVLARKNFLERKYYKKVADSISLEIKKITEKDEMEKVTLLDAGCGEAYYTDKIDKEINSEIYAIDISKEAIKYAARKNKKINFSVASVFELPIKTSSIDIVYSIFAPFKDEEFARVLKDNGYFIQVSPASRHLYGLKMGLYENPYLNNEEKFVSDYFEEIYRFVARDKIKIEDKEDVENLIKMTPYYWNTDKKIIEDYIENFESLETELEFLIKIMKKRDKE